MKKQNGQIAVELLFLSAIVVSLITGFVSLSASFLQLSLRAQNKLQAFSIAEAGIEYYRWHLAHNPNDYWDGNSSSTAGPYLHPYYDKNANQVGQFSLAITPPPQGSNVVIVTSAGTVLADASIKKIITVKLVQSSLMQYNIVQATNLLIGASTTIYGPVMSNGGINFNGFAYNVIQSALSTYNDPSDGNSWAVHTDISPADPTPPAAPPLRADVFSAGRLFSQSAVDFGALANVLSNLQTTARNGGVYASSSGVYGFDLAFSTSTNATNTYSLYKVTAIASPPNGCTNVSNQDGWTTWSIGNETLVATGTIPRNGTFFVNDNLWVRGQINHAHVLIGAAVFPDNSNTWANVAITNDLRYTNYDGSDSIVVMTQNNINVGLYSNDVLRMDGAYITEYGRVGRFFYKDHQGNSNKCAPYAVRSKVTIFGSIVTNQSYQFGYDDGTGYQNRQILYDVNLLYAPPSIVPITQNFTIVSWDEVQ